MAHNYTSEQLSALDVDNHVSVQANAGSGKTKILVDRYFNLLVEKNIKPQNILAITFTKKAASEMKSRIILQIEENLNNAIKKEDSKKAAKLRVIRENLIKAKISTIHSFCSGIMRDYPIEAGVQPNFTELDEIELLRLEDDAIDQIISDYVDLDNKPDYFLLDQFEINQLVENLKFMLGKPDILLNLEDVLYDENYIANIRDKFLLNLVSIFTQFSEDLFLVANMLDNKKDISDGAKNKTKIFIEIIQNVSRKIENEIIWLNEFYDILIQLNQQNIITNNGTLHGNSFRNTKKFNYDEIKEILTKYSDDFANFKTLLEIFVNDKSEIHYEYIKEFFQLSLKTYNKFNDLKDLINGISYDDMIIRAKKALDNDNVKEQISKKYEYIMVDEFQDTNQIQYDLIKNFVSEFNNENLTKNNLYIVGDAKQSIYRFRNADVQVFLKAISDIIELNKKNGKSDNTGKVDMTYTFRLFPVIADYINKVCAPAFEFNESIFSSEDYKITYEDLQFGKTDDIFPKMIAELSDRTLTDKFGKIDYLFSIKEYSDANIEEDDEDDDVNNLKGFELESKEIVNYISTIVNNPEHRIYDDELSDFRKIKYSDIAILARKKSGFGALQTEFIKNEIPFVINSGSGFYNTQEIMDFTAFIKFLNDNSDDVSLAAILKGDFFKLNDTELFKIAHFSRKSSYWEKFKDYSASDEATDLAKRAFRILTNLIPAARRIPVSGLIDLITEETGWYGIVRETHGVEQKTANVKKLKDYSISFENKGFKGLYDFAGQLSQLTESSNEGEAVYHHGKNAVNVMTIHASKGLEFPVVILYMTNSKSSGNTSTINADKDHGIAFKYNDLETGEKEDTIISKYINEKVNEAENEEEKRILYVALTRAKYRLCLSILLVMKKDGSTQTPKGLFKLISSAFNDLLDLDKETSKLYTDQLNMNITGLNKNINFNGYSYEVSAFNHSGKFVKQDNMSVEEKIDNRIYLMDDIQRSHSKEIFSPTKLQTWLNEINNKDNSFTRKYLLGLREEKSDYTEVINIENEVFGASKGTVIHAVMEDMHEWVDENFQLDHKKLQESIKYHVEQNDFKNPEVVTNNVYSNISSVMYSDFIQSRLDKILKSRFEYELNLSVGEDFITGLIDLLYIDENGKYEIWDWKSNYTGSNDEEKTDKYIDLRKKYSLQMKIYCYFISLLKPEEERYTARLLLTMDALNNSDNENWIIKYEWSKKEMEDFIEELKKLISEIKENHLYSRYLVKQK